MKQLAEQEKQIQNLLRQHSSSAETMNADRDDSSSKVNIGGTGGNATTEDLANVLLSAVSAVTGNFDSSSKMNIHGDNNTQYNTTNNYNSAGINQETLQGIVLDSQTMQVKRRVDSQTQEVERIVQDSAQDHKDQTQHVAKQVAQTLTAKKT